MSYSLEIIASYDIEFGLYSKLNHDMKVYEFLNLGSRLLGHF